jgi:hypothetical protein
MLSEKERNAELEKIKTLQLREEVAQLKVQRREGQAESTEQQTKMLSDNRTAKIVGNYQTGKQVDSIRAENEMLMKLLGGGGGSRSNSSASGATSVRTHRSSSGGGMGEEKKTVFDTINTGGTKASSETLGGSGTDKPVNPALFSRYLNQIQSPASSPTKLGDSSLK